MLSQHVATNARTRTHAHLLRGLIDTPHQCSKGCRDRCCRRRRNISLRSSGLRIHQNSRLALHRMHCYKRRSVHGCSLSGCIFRCSRNWEGRRGIRNLRSCPCRSWCRRNIVRTRSIRCFRKTLSCGKCLLYRTRRRDILDRRHRNDPDRICS